MQVINCRYLFGESMNTLMRWLADWDWDHFIDARFKHPAYLNQYGYRYELAERQCKRFI